MLIATRRFRLALACAFLAALSGRSALAQPRAPEDGYPNRPIRMILPSTPGGGIDPMGRLIAHHLSASLGQAVVPENRPGSAGVVGVSAVKSAAPDGYTIGFSNVSQIVTAHFLVKPQPYHPVRDFDAVALVYRVLLMLNAHSSIPPKTLGELVDYARKSPGKLTYASAGPGSLAHLWVELLKKREGIEILHVPYKGAAPAFQALLAGEAHLNIAESLTMGGAISSPQIRILVQLGEQRAKKLPDIPTVREAGFADLASDFWIGVVVPRGTPPGIIRRLNEDINRAIRTPEVQARVASAGGEAITTDAASFADTIASYTRTWEPIIRDLGLIPK